MVRARHCGAPARRPHRVGDALVVGRDHDRPDVGLDRAPPDMDDHRLAADVGERLARQAGRSHARGDENEGVEAMYGRDEVSLRRRAGLYVLPRLRQSG